MTDNKLLPISLVAGSFAAGIAGAVVYNKYLVRLERQVRQTNRRFTTSTPSIDPIRALLNQNDISVDVLNHLTRVYASLGATTLAAALGAYVQMKTNFSSTAANLISLGFALLLQSKADLWKLILFGAFSGAGVGDLIKLGLNINKSIVPLALASTTGIFSSFAAAATLSTRRSLLYLYGLLGSGLSILLFGGALNLYFQSRNMFNLQLYGGLALFLGYVCADSQLIIERADLGDDDYVTHSWMLFTDLSGIFRRVLIILIQQAEEDKKKKQRREQRDL